MRFDSERPARGKFGGWRGSAGEGHGGHCGGGRFGERLARKFAGRFDDEGGPFGGGPFDGGPFGGGPFGGGRGGRGGGGPFGRGRGGRGRMFAAGELRLLLLSLVAEQDRHGYELIKAVEDLTGGQYAPSPGVVYPTLALLVDEGLIAEAAGEGTRKAFTATEAGRAELAGKTEELKVIVDRLTSLAQAGAREASPPVRRAFANLALALRQRVAGGSFDNDTALAVADILDEAARKIERL
ncbi:PadR family transcriptional regulator [Novosphingobium capsulatum]|uniref:PadR family transcriptional regulator n=1 Tax=Novosphingobium capsulatum TaxID=13688 RepID=UPI0009FF4072|nr:PadR family transcriptional regulator [Novosphingobium capsulatum]WQD94338.1 PadR family transcriptional regulator [Novosphingobium capsulatum]